MVEITTSRVTWPKTHRLIMSHFPPINLFDDIADPKDWEALAMAQSRTNPRIYEEIGDLSLVPLERRLTGDGASWVMAAFTHISTDRTSRFSDGTFGVYYAGDSLETALREHTFHMERFYQDANTGPGWVSEVRQLIGAIDTDLVDLREGNQIHLLDPDITTYPTSQAFAIAQKAAGHDGIVYPSLRHPEGACIGVFYPDAVGAAVQGDHFRYHWNGQRVDYAQILSGDRAVLELVL